MKSDQQIEDALMDRLMDGEATMTDLSCELHRTPSLLTRVAGQLKAQGLIESRLVESIYGRPEVRYYMARTRKAA